VVDVVVGGEREAGRRGADGGREEKEKSAKRKAVVLEEEAEERPVSKREMKRRAKKAREEGKTGNDGDTALGKTTQNGSAKEREVETAPATSTLATADGDPEDAPKEISTTVD